jgi:hypothetical protein
MSAPLPVLIGTDELQPDIPWRVALQQSSASASPAGSSFILPAASVNYIVFPSAGVLPLGLYDRTHSNPPGLLANSEMAQRSIPAFWKPVEQNGLQGLAI